MDNSLLRNALLENVFFKGLQAYTNANCGFLKFVRQLEMEESYVLRQMIYLHSKCQTKVPKKQKILIIIKRRQHVSM